MRARSKHYGGRSALTQMTIAIFNLLSLDFLAFSEARKFTLVEQRKGSDVLPSWALLTVWIAAEGKSSLGGR